MQTDRLRDDAGNTGRSRYRLCRCLQLDAAQGNDCCNGGRPVDTIGFIIDHTNAYLIRAVRENAWPSTVAHNAQIVVFIIVHFVECVSYRDALGAGYTRRLYRRNLQDIFIGIWVSAWLPLKVKWVVIIQHPLSPRAVLVLPTICIILWWIADVRLCQPLVDLNV